MGDRLINDEETMMEGDVFGAILAAAVLIIQLAAALAGCVPLV